MIEQLVKIKLGYEAFCIIASSVFVILYAVFALIRLILIAMKEQKDD